METIGQEFTGKTLKTIRALTQQEAMILAGLPRLHSGQKEKKGGEQIEFFAGGIIGDNPDSLEKLMQEPLVTTLSNSWKKYTIDLTSKDLSHVIGGFGWAANSDNNPNGATFYLMIYKQQNPALMNLRFLVSYETLSFTDPDRYIKNACYIYDNALALIAFWKEGQVMTWRGRKYLPMPSFMPLKA